MSFFGTAQGWEGGGWQKGIPFLKFVKHIQQDETWHNYILPKEDPENI